MDNKQFERAMNISRAVIKSVAVQFMTIIRRINKNVKHELL